MPRKKRNKASSKRSLRPTDPRPGAPSATVGAPGNHSMKKYHVLFIALLAMLGYGNTLNNYFVLDDALVILSNEFTQKGIAGIKDIWTNDMFVGTHGREFDLAGGRYRPLSMTVFAMMYELFGDYTNEEGVKSRLAFAGHLINMLFFIATCALIYLVLLRWLSSFNEWIPLTTALLFAVHPIHTEVVANIKSLDEILSLFFLLCTLYVLPRDSSKNLLLACLFYFLSLLSKENTITALAIIPILYVFFRRRHMKSGWIKTAALSGIAIVYLIMREIFSGGFFSELAAKNLMDNPFLGMDYLSTRIPTVLVIAGKYLSLLFIPYPLSYDYSYDAIGWRNWVDPFVILSLVVILVALAWAIQECAKRLPANAASIRSPHKILAFGILFYAAAYSIISNVFFNIGTYMGERFIYMPSLGFCLSLAAVIAILLKVDINGKFQFKIAWFWPFMLVVPLALYATISRNMDWKDGFSLYEVDAKKVQRSARARMFLGIQHLNSFNKSGNDRLWESSIDEINAAIDIYPEFYHAHYNLGLAYKAKRDYAMAVRSFERVLELQPQHLNSTYFLGVAYGGIGQHEKAIQYIEKGIKHGYKGVDRYFNLGVAYGQKGEFQQALGYFQRALEENPRSAAIYRGMALTYENLGQPLKAKEYYQKASDLNSSTLQNME